MDPFLISHYPFLFTLDNYPENKAQNYQSVSEKHGQT